MLGVPISFSDLEFLDEELYRSAMWIRDNDGVEAVGLDFSVVCLCAHTSTIMGFRSSMLHRVADVHVYAITWTEYHDLSAGSRFNHVASSMQPCLEAPGEAAVVDLKPNGRQIEVTDENKREYLDLLLRYRMLDSISDQLSALLKGMFEVIPENLLSVFDYQELELVLCGT